MTRRDTWIQSSSSSVLLAAVYSANAAMTLGCDELVAVHHSWHCRRCAASIYRVDIRTTDKTYPAVVYVLIFIPIVFTPSNAHFCVNIFVALSNTIHPRSLKRSDDPVRRTRASVVPEKKAADNKLALLPASSQLQSDTNFVCCCVRSGDFQPPDTSSLNLFHRKLRSR